MSTARATLPRRPASSVPTPADPARTLVTPALAALALGALLALLLTPVPAAAQPNDPDFRDIGPTQSNLDNQNPNGASGGRVNGLAGDPLNAFTYYAASEWGGLWKSTDGGDRWFHLPGHVPPATWDVAVWPTDTNRVFATSFYDGRVFSEAGISVSLDAGTTWYTPAGSRPPVGFCTNPARWEEPSAFGISIDPDNPDDVWVGTNCGLARSTDGGLTWTYLDPTPADPADDVWDVVVHDGGIVDLCGNDGHLRSTDGGATWTGPVGMPRPAGGRCSIDVSPDEPYVIFVVAGTTIYESDDGGANWQTFVTPGRAQGRIPFVAVNDRAGQNFDLWFADVSLFRAPCVTPAPAAPGGAARCPAAATWINAQTGAHNDAGDLAFRGGVEDDACPTLYSNDGGIYRETQGTDPECHAPLWEQPAQSPRALWQWDLDTGHAAGANEEGVYFGNQDTGLFGTTQGPVDPPFWNNAFCCDGFDVAAEEDRVVTSLCCFGGRATRLFVCDPGMVNCNAFAAGDYPAGNVIAFTTLDALDNYGDGAYALVTTSGVFVTADVTANPVAWTQLGGGPADPLVNPCGIQAATEGGTTTFFVKDGGCDGDRPGPLYSYEGTAAGNAWQQITRGGNSQFGVYAVDPSDPKRLLASDLAPPVPEMVLSTDGGATWNPLPDLDDLMNGNGQFRTQNRRGPRFFTQLNGYPQPSLVAFSPADPMVVLAGGVDSGIFLSLDGGGTWQLITDPLTPGLTGIPHIPRPHHAVFDHEVSGRVHAYVGTKGRGVWRITFSSPGPGAVAIVPVGWSFDYHDSDHHIDGYSLRVEGESLDDSVLPATLAWQSHVRYHDQNSDDDYSWEVTHGILDLDNAFTASGDSLWLTDGGGSATASGSHTDPALAGFQNVQVALKGWSFDYDDSDHHIDRLGIELRNVVFDPATSTVSWQAVARFADQNSDDDFSWRYQWQVIATNEGAFRRVDRTGSDGGGSDTDSAAEVHASLQGFQEAAVLLQGWSFDFSDSDHHIDRSAFRINNVHYAPATGHVTWDAALTYADQNSDDDFSWSYSALVLAFNGAEPIQRQDGPFDDDGGGDSEGLSVTLP